MRRVLPLARQLLAAARMLAVLTVILGVGYPLAVTALARVPGMASRADGSTTTAGGNPVGSTLIGQSFTTSTGDALPQYFQSRPSNAGKLGYDPTSSGAGNLGPESVVDTLPDPSNPDDRGMPSLLSTVCTRSVAVGALEGVDGSRPFCTPDGVGAVLAVFWSGPGYAGTITRVVTLNQTAPVTPFLATYQGVPVELAQFGQDYTAGQVVPVRGNAPPDPVVPAAAVTGSGSGLDPEISPEWAHLQTARVAAARGVSADQVAALVNDTAKGRDLGFLGEPRVNVLRLNLALDAAYPAPAK